MQVSSDKSSQPAPIHTLPFRIALLGVMEAKVLDKNLKAEASAQIDLCFEILAFQTSHNVGDSDALVNTMESLCERLLSALYIEAKQSGRYPHKLKEHVVEEIKADLVVAGYPLPEGHSLGKVSAVRI